MAQDNQRILSVATEAARQAGSPLMKSFGRQVSFKEKSRRDFVTPQDAVAEASIIGKIHASFPDHSVLAEESGEHARDPEYRWILDPLSSTRNYLHGVPHWAVCIAVERLGIPVVSVVLDPFCDELYTAVAGDGAHRNGIRMGVSRVPYLGQAMMCASFNVEGEDAEKRIAMGLGYYSRLARVADLRSFGSAGLHLAMVADGRFDAFVNSNTDFFATIAGALLVREAGGVVTDFDGEEWIPSSPTLAASNGLFHQQLLQVVRGA